MALSASCLLAVAPAVVHADIGAEIALGSSDNIDRREVNGTDEDVLSARIGGQIDRTGPTEGLLRWEVGGLTYLGGSFDDELLAFLDGWVDAQISDDWSWFAQENLGRQAVDPFEVISPANQEYTSYLSTGPRGQFGLGPQLGAEIELWFSNVWYETRNLENNRTGGRFGIARSRPGGSAGVYAASEQIRFANANAQDDYTRQELYGQYESRSERNQLIISLGWTRITELEGGGDSPLAEFQWIRHVSTATDFTIEVGSRYSDAGEIFRFNQTRQDSIGATQDSIGVGSPFKSTYAGFRYDLRRDRTNASVNFLWAEEDYDNQDELDRKLPTLEFTVSRLLGQRWRAGLFGNYAERDFTEQERVDTDKQIGVEFGFISGRTALDLSISKIERESDVGQSFDETRIFIAFSLGAQLGR